MAKHNGNIKYDRPTYVHEKFAVGWLLSTIIFLLIVFKYLFDDNDYKPELIFLKKIFIVCIAGMSILISSRWYMKSWLKNEILSGYVKIISYIHILIGFPLIFMVIGIVCGDNIDGLVNTENREVNRAINGAIWFVILGIILGGPIVTIFRKYYLFVSISIVLLPLIILENNRGGSIHSKYKVGYYDPSFFIIANIIGLGLGLIISSLIINIIRNRNLKANVLQQGGV